MILTVTFLTGVSVLTRCYRFSMAGAAPTTNGHDVESAESLVAPSRPRIVHIDVEEDLSLIGSQGGDECPLWIEVGRRAGRIRNAAGPPS